MHDVNMTMGNSSCDERSLVERITARRPKVRAHDDGKGCCLFVGAHMASGLSVSWIPWPPRMR